MKYYLHYDMDAFFASIEIRDNSEYKDKAIAVGGGVITTCNYIARKKGVKSAMPITKAMQLCPELQVIKPRVKYYFSVGREIQNYIAKHFKEVEFTSCDEGYVNITEYVKNEKDILKICTRFKNAIIKKFNLSLSVGVGFNKSMAKMATEINKPNGLYIFKDKKDFLNYVYEKDISIFPGIGKKTKEILNKNGIKKTKDFYYKSKEELIEILGINIGDRIYELVRGNKSYFETDKQSNTSIAKEHTYNNCIIDEKEVINSLKEIVNEFRKEKKINNLYPRTITIKIRLNDFSTITKSKTMISPINLENLEKIVIDLYKISKIYGKIRLVGISFSNFSKENYEYLKLF